MTLHKPILTERIVIRATADQLHLWVRMANAEHRRTLSEWIRRVLDRECGVAGEITTVETEETDR